MVPGDLRDKYLRLQALRERHARARRDASYVEPDPRPELARLAAEFPGALREIDRLPDRVIAERIASLDAVLAGGPVAPWMETQMLFHDRARLVLAAKRALAGRRQVTDEDRRTSPEVADELETIASPPGGRLMPLVVAWVAARLGTSAARVRSLVFADREG